MSFGSLNPEVVLMHLQEMGYQNITHEKLEEFIKDLKKLIKHESRKKKVETKKQEETTSSTLPNTTDESMSPSSPPTQCSQRKHRSHYNSGRSTKHIEAGGEASCSSSESSIAPSRRVLQEFAKVSAEDMLLKELQHKCVETFKLPSKPSKSCDCLWRRIGCKCCEEKASKEQNAMKTAKSKENVDPPRPKSSFIRGWQSRPGSASQRSDPVALYHQYQQVWKQQKLPGENKHSDLRWMIRERMLGQEPHPRNRAVVVPALAALVS